MPGRLVHGHQQCILSKNPQLEVRLRDDHASGRSGGDSKLHPIPFAQDRPLFDRPSVTEDSLLLNPKDDLPAGQLGEPVLYEPIDSRARLPDLHPVSFITRRVLRPSGIHCAASSP